MRRRAERDAPPNPLVEGVPHGWILKLGVDNAGFAQKLGRGGAGGKSYHQFVMMCGKLVNIYEQRSLEIIEDNQERIHFKLAFFYAESFFFARRGLCLDDASYTRDYSGMSALNRSRQRPWKITVPGTLDYAYIGDGNICFGSSSDVGSKWVARGC